MFSNSMIKIKEVCMISHVSLFFVKSLHTHLLHLLWNEWWQPSFKALTIFIITYSKLLASILISLICREYTVSCLPSASLYLPKSQFYSNSPAFSSQVTAVCIHLNASKLPGHIQIKPFLPKSYLLFTTQKLPGVI